ncbi:hypothetical protein J4231_02520 [Candidatus Woesearchaeota archaeon]|nr:hypothetical protein [Candidatus Woesearchaeota archaeon]
MNPKVLVGCPTSSHKSYCLAQYASAIKSMSYDNFDVLLVDNSKGNSYFRAIKSQGLPVVKVPYTESAKQRIVDSRNIIRRKVLDCDYDYFLSLEQDVIPPKDVIQRLIRHDKGIVSGVYFTYQKDKAIELGLRPVLYKKSGTNSLKVMLERDVLKPRLIEVGACGLGCVLIRKDILKNIRFRFSKDFEGFDDVWFCYDAFNLGFKVYADTSVKCKHLISGWTWDSIKE